MALAHLSKQMQQAGSPSCQLTRLGPLTGIPFGPSSTLMTGHAVSTKPASGLATAGCTWACRICTRCRLRRCSRCSRSSPAQYLLVVHSDCVNGMIIELLVEYKY